MSRRDSLVIPFDFIHDPTLRTLALAAGDEVPVMLGRLVAMSIAITSYNRVKFLLTEIDSITGWRGKESVAKHIESVGWCKSEGKTGVVVKLTLPKILQSLNVRTIAGQARAKSAARDSKGRYLTPATGTPERYPKRKQFQVNADGSLVE